jgi:hypothetical protein
MRRKGARTLTVTSTQALGNVTLLRGPLRLCGWSMNDGNPTQSSTVDQSAAAPGAGATVASISLGNGPWQIEWTLELSGTPAAADADNVQLFIGATLLATSVNAGAVGNYPQEEVQAIVVFGPLTLAWKAIGAATAGSVYKVEANIVPTGASTGQIRDGAQNLGFIGIAPGINQTVWFERGGIQVDTEISVQTLAGLIQGVLYYYLDSDLDPEHEPDDDYGG